MRDLAKIISSYASVEGYNIFGTRFTKNGRYFYMEIEQMHINIYFSKNKVPLYKIENIKDCVNFCHIISVLGEVEVN
ncbi:conserved hypothetical protein [Vibrio owensii]|nr:conserved hypothetical protein [Vibrio owensii]CAH1586392.1 conserved hypothetical protein [Vibrio owensii]